MPVAAVLIVLAAAVIFYEQESGQPPDSRTTPRTEARRAAPRDQGAITIAGMATVVDGDTITVSGTRVRLHGIDAPEGAQACRLGNREWACGTVSTAQLREFIGGSEVRCAPTGMDRYGRTLARCQVRDTDLQSWMVVNGWAVAYSRYSRDYEPEQQQAQEQRLGIWQGHVDLPEDWRRANRRR